MRVLLLAALLVVSLPSSAQIYKSVDDQGNVSYSDTPPQSGSSEEVKLRTTNSTPPPPAVLEPLDSEPAPPATDEESPYDYFVEIESPDDETTIAMGPGNFSVSVSVDPALGQNDLLQLYVDGAAVGEPQSSTIWGLTNIFRGAHDLTVAVTDKQGNQLTESDPVRVYVLRPSVNFSNRSRPRPTPR